ncbi:MAG: hypothetical protein R3F59_03085 [Myxococcota bacterium]
MAGVLVHELQPGAQVAGEGEAVDQRLEGRAVRRVEADGGEQHLVAGRLVDLVGEGGQGGGGFGAEHARGEPHRAEPALDRELRQ